MDNEKIDDFISSLLDAIQKAIQPVMIKRSWLERHIRPVVNKFFLSDDVKLKPINIRYDPINGDSD